MLSYQHAYHAGNLADVHKHLALVMLLERLRQKDKPICYVDAHAGRGLYDLDSDEAKKTGEADSGIRRLAFADDAPDGVREYLSLVSAGNADDVVRYYPGSAGFARAMLRDGDRGILIERHPGESDALRRFIGGDKRFGIHVRDCYEALPALLPPAIRRGIVLIDPSYEIKDEYERIVALLGKALRRWATAVYVLWYPLLSEARHRRLRGAVDGLSSKDTLVSEYTFSDSAMGLRGSGLVILNAPWQFDEELRVAMRYVTDVLGHGAHEVSTLGA